MALSLDSAVGPRTNFSGAWQDYEWVEFRRKIVDRNKESLDLVIEVVEVLLESGIEKESFDVPFDWFTEDKPIKRGDITHNVLDYLRIKTNEQRLEDVELSTKYTLNLTCNILRYLKRVRDDEWLVNLLPKEDREYGEGFLHRVGFPPRDLHSF